MAALRILIVDDDGTHADDARAVLAAEGYDVDIHPTAFGAAERLIRTRPDLVLIAVNDATRSGEALAAVLRRRVHAAGVRVLLCGAQGEEALRRAVRRLDLDGHVRKGDARELRRKVRRALGPAAGRSHPGREATSSARCPPRRGARALEPVEDVDGLHRA